MYKKFSRPVFYVVSFRRRRLGKRFVWECTKNVSKPGKLITRHVLVSRLSVMRPTASQVRFLVRIDGVHCIWPDIEVGHAILELYLPLNRLGENDGDYQFPKQWAA